MSSDKNAGPWVYFIQAGEGGPIKIGFTTGSPWARMANLQTANASRLKMLAFAPAGQEHERGLHEAFAPHRMSGEWFKPCPEIMACVYGVGLGAGRGRQPPREPETTAYEPPFTEEQLSFIGGMLDAAICSREASALELEIGLEPKPLPPKLFAAARGTGSVLGWIIHPDQDDEDYKAGAAHVSSLEMIDYDVAFLDACVQASHKPDVPL